MTTTTTSSSPLGVTTGPDQVPVKIIVREKPTAPSSAPTVAIVCVTLIIVAAIAAAIIYIMMKARAKRPERRYQTQMDDDLVAADSITVAEGQVLDVIDGNGAESDETDIEL